MRPILFSLLLMVGTAFAASSYEEASTEIAKAIAPKLQGKTVAILDLTDVTGNVRELGRVLATQNLNTPFRG